MTLVGEDISNYHKVTNLHSVAGTLKTKSQCFKQKPLKICPGSIVVFKLNLCLKFWRVFFFRCGGFLFVFWFLVVFFWFGFVF